jgi:hypothetical protein
LCYNTLSELQKGNIHGKNYSCYRTGETQAGESKDCTVRALANVTGIAYSEAHHLLETIGLREANSGAHFSNYHKAYLKAGAKRIAFFGKKGVLRSKTVQDKDVISGTYTGMTFETALRHYHTGRYIFIMTGHAVAVINGHIYDTGARRAGRRMVAVFTF